MSELQMFKSSLDGKQLAENFLIIRHAGHDVYICIPHAKAAISDGLNTGHQRDVSNLLKQLVAVKVDTPSREVSLLKEMETHITDDPKTQRTARLLVEGTFDDEFQNPITWFSMPAISSCLSVEDVIQFTSKPMPRAFVFHFFLQLLDALIFLHSHCGIVHKDLHFGNIMLDASKQDFPGLPNLVLIDFGNSETTNLPSTYRWERNKFCCVVGDLIVHNTDCAVCKQNVRMASGMGFETHEHCGSIGSGDEIHALFEYVKTYCFEVNCPSLGEMEQAMGQIALDGRSLGFLESAPLLYDLIWEPAISNQLRLGEEAIAALDDGPS